MNFCVEEYNLEEANCLLVKSKLDFVIIAIYRPPSFENIDKFLSSLQILLKNLVFFKSIVLVGDININIAELHSDATEYLDMLIYMGLTPTYYTPTRGKSCLDHAIIKTKQTTITFKLQTAITDHESVLLCLHTRGYNFFNKTKTFTKLNFENLVNDYKQMDFSKILAISDINYATNMFLEFLNTII